MKRWTGTFTTLPLGIIQPHSVIFRTLHTQKSGLLGILEYSKSFHNCITRHIQNPVIFTKIYEYSNSGIKTDTYAEPSQRFRMTFSAKIVKNYNYFSKVLHLRSLTGFWIRLSLNKYSLTCRVTSPYILYDTYSEPCLLA